MGLINKEVTEHRYTVMPDAIKALIAQDLKVPVECVKIHFVIEEVGCDPLDRFPGRDEVTKVQVTVTEKPVEAKKVYPSGY